MSKAPTFSQCRLVRQEGDVRTETVSWIPTKLKSNNGLVNLRLGLVVDLQEEDKTWTRNWTVESMGPTTENPPDYRALIRGHRKMTGDSMPRGQKEG